MQIVNTRITQIFPEPLLEGSKYAYSVKHQYGEVFLVSPAVYELLQDDEVREQVMKDVKVFDLVELINKEIEQMIK